jgi:hypothetical protein
VTVEDTVGGGEVVFITGGPSGSNVPAPWIQGPPHLYVFRLYNTSGGGHTLLATRTVGGFPTGTITASPNPCVITGGPFCSSSISWTTAGIGTTQVTVEDALGGGEVVFYNGGATGTNIMAPWIQAAPHSYTFRLYATFSGGPIMLNSVTVTGGAGPGAKPAVPRPGGR